MDIKLKWTNRNTTPVTIKIYRNETQVPNDQLANPIATLANAANEYTDTTAVRRKTYYYVIETTDGNIKTYSLPKKVYADFTNGPGPRDLIWGDSNLGYFGTIESIDFLTPAEIAGAVIPALLNSPPSNPIPQWHKWIRRGKVCFVPAQPVCSTTYINALYSAGLVHGIDGDGPWVPTGYNPTNQMKTIQKGFDKFIVRLPTGSDDRNNPSRTIPGTGQTVAVRRNSEMSDLYYPMVRGFVPSSQRPPNVESYVVSSSMNAGRQLATCTMFGTTGTLQGVATSFTTSAEMEAIGAIVAFGTAVSWSPLLELVPQPPVVEI